MFSREIWHNPIWCLYDTTDGRILLKHPWRLGLPVSCPQCGGPLTVENYKAECCGRHFRIGFNEITQVEPVGTHSRTSGRGWASLRVYSAGDAEETNAAG